MLNYWSPQSARSVVPWGLPRQQCMLTKRQAVLLDVSVLALKRRRVFGQPKLLATSRYGRGNTGGHTSSRSGCRDAAIGQTGTTAVCRLPDGRDSLESVGIKMAFLGFANKCEVSTTQSNV